MKRKIGAILCISLMVSIMCLGNTLAAVESGTSTATVYGITYTYWSGIEKNDYNGKIQGYTAFDAGKTINASYVGSKERIYSSTGVLVSSSDWRYGTGVPGYDTCVSGKSYHSYDPTETPNYSYYYSRGQFQFYNGNGYTTYTCKATPNISSGLSKSISAQVSTNKNGEVYGSELYLNEIGIEPDLINALGEDGVVGYVKRADLDALSIDNPMEVESYESNKPIYRTIPLYECDGETEIGVFVVNNDVEIFLR